MNKATAPSAGQKLPPLGPGGFRIVTKNIEIEKAEGDGPPRRRFKVVMSSTIKDRRGDEIKPPALQKMRDQFAEGKTIFMDHDHKVASAFGTSDYSEIKQTGLTDPETGQPVYDLIVAGNVNEPNAAASTLADSLEGGYVKFGASIGIMVTNHKKNAEGAMDIWDVETMEGSIVGIPMNQRSWVTKAMDAIEDLDEDDEELILKEEKSMDELTASGTTVNGTIGTGSISTSIVTGSTTWVGGEAGPEKVAGLNTDNGAALQTQGLTCKSCDHDAGCDCDMCDCGESIHTTKSVADADIVTKGDDEEPAEDETAPGGQEAPAEDATPETAPAEADETEDSDAADQASTEVTASFDPEDVVALVGHARSMVVDMVEQANKIAALETENTTLKTQNAELSTENEAAKSVIEKMMAAPLAPRAQGHLQVFKRTYPDFLAPEVANFLNKTAGDSQ